MIPLYFRLMVVNKNERDWQFLARPEIVKNRLSVEEIVGILLENRGLKTQGEKEEFFNPTHPDNLTLPGVGIDSREVDRAINRIKKAVDSGEMIVVYGDYDVDGISGAGILFESLFLLSKNVHPHLPERFKEGYGLNPLSVEQLKKSHPGLGVIITVDNGISAHAGVEKAGRLGIDVIILDHHHKKGKDPKSFATVYTEEIGGAEIAWIFARELRRKLKIEDSELKRGNGLELAAMGTIADMLPLVGPNRSFAWHGIKALRATTRPGLIALFRQSGIEEKNIGPYEVNYVIAPRLNAMGRLELAIDSLRLICTASEERGKNLAEHLGRVNTKRQGIQEEILLHARNMVGSLPESKVLVLADESYHEGVVGLAAARLAEEFNRPAVVLWKSEGICKGSARSIPGFDLFAALTKVSDLLVSWGGHKAAAGLTLKTSNLEVFTKQFARVSEPLLTDDILERKLKIDVQLGFESLSRDLLLRVKEFDPTGMGNPAPVFATENVSVRDKRAVGRDWSHLKLQLNQGVRTFDAIAFKMGPLFEKLSVDSQLDIAYNLEEDNWNGRSKIQLKIKDIKIK